MGILSICTSPLIAKYYGSGDTGIHGCYKNGIGRKQRKAKKAKRRALKQARRKNR